MALRISPEKGLGNAYRPVVNVYDVNVQVRSINRFNYYYVIKLQTQSNTESYQITKHILVIAQAVLCSCSTRLKIELTFPTQKLAFRFHDFSLSQATETKIINE